MKRILILLAFLALLPGTAFAKSYPFTLAEPDPKAEAAIRELYDAGQLKSLTESNETLVAIWLKASETEPLYLFVSPHGICEIASCWIVGFRQTTHGWAKIYDQPVGEDIDIGVTPHEIDGHHDVLQVDEKGDKRIEKTSTWTGARYSEPKIQESAVTDEPAPPADSEDKN